MVMASVLLAKLEEVRATPPEERVFSAERERRTGEILGRLERMALSRRIKGKYAEVPISSDEFAKQKAEEIALEDRGR
jgi:hypothetical protein